MIRFIAVMVPAVFLINPTFAVCSPIADFSRDFRA
jgi:hypothetical protein